MALTIKWTKRASDTFHKTVDYIEEEWGDRSAGRFIKKVNRFLDLLQENPRMGKIEFVDKQIRGCVISRQTTVFYRVDNHKIVLLKFFDNRQNPGKKYT